MKLVDRTVKVPEMSLPSERDREGGITNAVRAHFGRAALEVGTPDHGLNGTGTDGCRTDATDTIANILHWLRHRGIDPASVLASAGGHFRAETASDTVEQQALSILTDAGIDAHLFHTGGGIWVTEARSTTIPGRTVWVSDSEGRDGGPFLLGAYPEPGAQDWIDHLSGPCTADELPDRARRALTAPAAE